MTEPKAQGQEPTMEEILASIRRIISENDDPNAAAAAQAKPSAPSPRPQPADDGVLELTDMVGADGKVVNLAAAKSAPSLNIPEPPATEEFQTMADQTPDPAPQAAETPADDVELSAVETRPSRTSDSGESLVTGATAAASTAAFAALAQQLTRKGDETSQASESLAIGSGRTLEDLVKEMLRPMLRDWLDANLPGMVERLVKREIERIVRSAQD
jgi:cell pole-organizing protein PopZ